MRNSERKPGRIRKECELIARLTENCILKKIGHDRLLTTTPIMRNFEKRLALNGWRISKNEGSTAERLQGAGG